MCNFDAILGKIVAVQVMMLAVIVTLGVAIVVNSGVFTAAGTPAIVAGAAVVVGVALALVLAAISEANACSQPRCVVERSRLTNALSWLSIYMGGLVIGLAAAALASWVPYVGTIGLIVIITSIGAMLTEWGKVSDSIEPWVRCETSTPPPPAAAAGKVLGILLAVVIAAFLVAMVAMMPLGFIESFIVR